MLPEHRGNIHPAPSILDRAARGENVVAALAALVR
jgi:hypothetical protein